MTSETTCEACGQPTGRSCPDCQRIFCRDCQAVHDRGRALRTADDLFHTAFGWRPGGTR